MDGGGHFDRFQLLVTSKAGLSFSGSREQVFISMLYANSGLHSYRRTVTIEWTTIHVCMP